MIPWLAARAAAALLVARPAVQQAQRPPQAPPAPHALAKLENDWAQAVIRRDAAAIRRLVAPGWVYSDESGIMDRDAGIRAFTTGTDTVTSAGNDGMRVHAYGSTAVVTGVLWMRGRGPTGAFLHRYRYTDTWVRLDGRWQCVASQDYLVPETGK